MSAKLNLLLKALLLTKSRPFENVAENVPPWSPGLFFSDQEYLTVIWALECCLSKE
jgi:hypothetical protein